MTPRNAFQARMIESLGGPLMAAVASVSGGAGGQPARAAQTMAELLNRSVQLGIMLAVSIDLKGGGDETDAVRLALTGLAGGLVAELYKQTGQVPGEADVRKLMPPLEAVLSFSDRFAPDAAAGARLQNLEPGSAPADSEQVTMQYIQALAPVITEIGAYSFGRPDRKMAQEAAERLTARAEAMRLHLFPGTGGFAARRLELGLLKSLTGLYIGCHRAEKNRLQAMDEADRGAMGATPSLDPLWTMFEERASMLEVLFPALSGGQGSGGTEAAAAPLASKPARATPVPAPPHPLPPPVQPATAGESLAADSGNPMAFFKPGAKRSGNASGTA